jgi:RNA polymerase sigma-32 factor
MKSTSKKSTTKLKGKASNKRPQSGTALPAKVPTLAPAVVESTEKSEALQNYLRSLKNYPLLTPEREFEVAKKYVQDRDSASAQLLILSNLRLVVKIAYEYLRAGIHVLDLIQEGNIGLLQAVKEFDPYKGVKLSSYASYWIKAYIRAFIIKNWSLVKIGTTRSQRALFYKLQKEKNRLEQLGISPEPKYLAERLHVKEKEIIEMSQRLGGKDISLNTPMYSDDQTGDTLLQSLKDTSEGADEKLANKEVADEFVERLNAFERTLTGKELIIFRERLRAEEPKTLQEIGDTYQITRERVRQIEARVMEKLKEYMKEHARFLKPTIDVKKNS